MRSPGSSKGLQEMQPVISTCAGLSHPGEDLTSGSADAVSRLRFPAVSGGAGQCACRKTGNSTPAAAVASTDVALGPDRELALCWGKSKQKEPHNNNNMDAV